MDLDFFLFIPIIFSGLKCGKDFYLGFSPERVDPGNLIYKTKNTPKVVGAVTKDGGEVGSGQTVTILYEIVPVGSDYEVPSVESRYGDEGETSISSADEYCVLNIRYKEPDGKESELRTYPVTTGMFTEEMDYDTSWAAGVAQVGMIYRDSDFAGTSD